MSVKSKVPDAYRAWLSPHLDLKSLTDALNRANFAEKVLVHSALLITRGDYAARIQNARLPFGSIREIERGEHASLYLLTVNDEDGAPERQVLVRVSPIQDTPLALVVSIGRQMDWRDGVARLIDWLYPTVYRPFLRQDDLRLIFETMQNSLDDKYEVRLTRVSSSRRLMHMRSRRKYASEMVWTDVEYQEAFDQAAKSLSYFKRTAFEVCERGSDGHPKSIGLEGLVTHDAHFATTTHFRWLARAAVQTAVHRASQDHAFSSNRARSDSSGPRPSTIAATFDESVTFDREDLGKLGGLLRGMPHAAVSVLHGNPYFHATVVDMRDGSSFDVLLASERRLLIIPQLRATEGAVSRLCRFVYEQIGEASFTDLGAPNGDA